MDGVTDPVLRQVFLRTGRPDVFFTEFVSCEALVCGDREKIIHDKLSFSNLEKPIVAQLWGNDPEKYFESIKILKDRKFDGVDLNFGCPDRGLIKSGSCGALIGNLKLSEKIILAAKKACGDLSLSVKTRIGLDKVDTERWFNFLLDFDLDAITVHGRTVRQMRNGIADWNEISKVKMIALQKKKRTVIIGNGDVQSRDDGWQKTKKFGIDGIMIGRAAVSDFWIFNKSLSKNDVFLKKKLELLVWHLELFKKHWGKNRHFASFNKYYHQYIYGFDQANVLRLAFMKLDNPDKAIALARSVIGQLPAGG